MMQRAKYEADYEPMQIITAAGEIYTLPANWSLSDAGSISFNHKLTDRSFTHGSALTGDGFAAGRTIKVSCNLYGATEQEYNEAVNQAYRYFGGKDYELRAGRADRRYKVAGCSKMDAKELKGFKQRRAEVTVTLLLADPFRYATVPTKVTNEYAEAVIEDTMVIDNPSGIDVPIIWTFTPPAGGTMADITIKHVESGQSFRLTDALLTAPAVGVVDAEKGTVRRDEFNAINAFSGVFLHAKAGTNHYLVTCPAGKVTATFTGRWII